MKRSVITAVIFIGVYFIIGMLINVIFQKLLLTSSEPNVTEVNNLFIYKYVMLTIISFLVVAVLYITLLRSRVITKKYILLFCLGALIANFFIERMFF